MKTKKQPTPTPSKNHVLLVTWHKEGDRKTIYSGLKCFCTFHSAYKWETINYWIGKRKLPYVCETITVEKLAIIRPS